MKSIHVIGQIIFDENYYDDMEDNRINLYMLNTKADVMEFSKNILLSGHGAMNRKLWQLPSRTKVEISKQLRPAWEEVITLKEVKNDLE